MSLRVLQFEFGFPRFWEQVSVFQSITWSIDLMLLCGYSWEGGSCCGHFTSWETHSLTSIQGSYAFFKELGWILILRERERARTLMNVECFRKKLESTERLLEPVPIIGILTGRFNTSFRSSVLCGLCHFCHVSFSCTPVNSDFDLFVYLLSLNLQQKLWSSSQELKHGTLTCPAHDHEIRSSPFQVKYFPSVKALSGFIMWL